MMRLTTLLRQADPLNRAEPPHHRAGRPHSRGDGLSARARAELRALVGGEPGASVAIAPPRRRRRVLVLSAALLAVVLVVAIPLLQRPVQGIPTAPAGPPIQASGIPAVTGRWVATAPSPLSGRRDAVTAWVADSFLVIGGTTTQPCVSSGGCAGEPAWLRDGARYLPATDSWRTIAPAPVPLRQAGGSANPYPMIAVLGQTLFVLQADRFLTYDTDADRWTALAPPPEPAYLAGASTDAILAYPASVCGQGKPEPCRGSERLTYFSYDPGTAAWTRHTAPLAVPSSVYGATVVGGHLVVSWLEKNGPGVESIQLDNGTVTARSSIPTTQRPMPVAVGRWAVWTRDETRAWLLDPVMFKFTNVALPEATGAFRVGVGPWQRDLPIATAGMIALHGHLYDPASGLWSVVPALPVPLPTQDPVIAGGTDAVLACYGWAGTAYAKDCHLLHPAPASRAHP